MAELARAPSRFAAWCARSRAPVGAGALIAALAGLTPPPAAHAQPRVEIVIAPESAQAARVGTRVLELLASAAVRPELRYAPSSLPAPPPTGDTLALVTIDLGGSTAVVVHVRAAADELTRELPRETADLDEATREAIATVVASSVDALLAGKPLPAAEPAAKPLAPPTISPAPAHTPAPAPAHTPAPAPAHTPAPAPARAPAPAPSRPTRSTPPPPHDPAPSDTRTRLPSAALQATLGYELGLWGEGTWLHGPRLALGYGVLTTWGRLGVRGEGFLAWQTRVAGEPLDADVSIAALRILAALEPGRPSAFGYEAALGLSAQLTSIEAASAPASTEPLAASSNMGWALRLYGGVVLHEGLGLFALGTALELDPTHAEYGVRHPDGFVTTHSAASVRPSLVLSAGLHW